MMACSINRIDCDTIEPPTRSKQRHRRRRPIIMLLVMMQMMFTAGFQVTVASQSADAGRRSEDNRISRESGNILRNLTRTQAYRQNIVTSPLDASAGIIQVYRTVRDIYNTFLGGTGTRSEGKFLQTRIPERVAFPCNVIGQRSRDVPSSVHRLRPGDIDIVAAVGDSLTSATAANSAALWEVLVENRGVAWCIGGQDTWRSHMTLPNILKEFNPKLFGYSLSDSFNVHRAAQFNVAENIATTSDMPFNAVKLVHRMRLDSRQAIVVQESINLYQYCAAPIPFMNARVDWNGHWKLMTFMIGGNDFCSDICFQTNATQWLNDNQEANLIKTLRYMRNTMPRTFINLVPSPLVSLSFSMDSVRVPWTCHLARPIECSCLFGPAYSSHRKLYRRLERRFVRIMERVSHMPEFHTDDFTVVFQPFFGESSVFMGRDTGDAVAPASGTGLDMDIMSIDCIHLSQKGHAVAANGLWNNMMQRGATKQLGLRPLLGRFECPSEERPFLATYSN